PDLRGLPHERSASRRTAVGWAPCVRGEQSRRASRRTAVGWAPRVRGEQSKDCVGGAGARTEVGPARSANRKPGSIAFEQDEQLGLAADPPPPHHLADAG